MKISIIEDEKILASKTAIKLKRNGFTVEVFNSFHEFKTNYIYNSDLYIIDLSLGDGNGFDLIKWLREEKQSNSPIIITSGYNDDDKKIYGLNIGADDYLAKPYTPDILIARIRALIRRSYKVSNTSVIKYKNIIYNTSNSIITKNGTKIELTAHEMRLAEFALFNIGKLFSRIELINSTWGESEKKQISDNTVNVTISRVRKKLGKEFDFQTKINKGYILEK